MEVSDRVHAPGALSLGKSPGTNSVGGWVGLRADLTRLGEVKNLPLLPEIEARPLGHPRVARSLHRIPFCRQIKYKPALLLLVSTQTMTVELGLMVMEATSAAET
jgi:hypothetical protein